ncbi:MAG: phage/plasmid primase, P4 family [Intestinibacter bartlettii]|nr:phage/plasmid primase, P4 family [Intestinibacter bartlettii]
MKNEYSKNVKFPEVYRAIKLTGEIRNLDGVLYKFNNKYSYFERMDNPAYEVNNLIPIEYRDVVSPSVLDLVIRKLKLDETLELNKKILNQEDYINLKNGVLFVPELELLEKDLDKFQFTYMINASYLEDEVLKRFNKENFNKFLKTSFENDEQRKLLLQVIGYLCTEYTQARIGVFLIGKTSGGKSVVCKMLENLIGIKNVSSLSLHEITEKFNIAKLKYAKINISTELNAKPIPNSGLIKALISNDCVYGAVKFEEGSFFKSRCKLVQVSNVLPELKGDSDSEGAFRDRMVVVNFPCKIDSKDRDRDLIKKLIAELDYIFTISIISFKQGVYDNNFIFDMPQDSINIVNECCISTKDKVAAFISDECVVSTDGDNHENLKEHSYILFEAFIDYCKQNFYTPCTQNEFTNAMLELSFKKHKFRKSGKNRIGFLGIDLK